MIVKTTMLVVMMMMMTTRTTILMTKTARIKITVCNDNLMLTTVITITETIDEDRLRNSQHLCQACVASNYAACVSIQRSFRKMLSSTRLVDAKHGLSGVMLSWLLVSGCSTATDIPESIAATEQPLISKDNNRLMQDPFLLMYPIVTNNLRVSTRLSGGYFHNTRQTVVELIYRQHCLVSEANFDFVRQASNINLRLFYRTGSRKLCSGGVSSPGMPLDKAVCPCIRDRCPLRWTAVMVC